MPKDFRCKACDYAISVGWYHYHEFMDGYAGRTRFACGGCGANQYVEHPAPLSKKDHRHMYHSERYQYEERSGLVLPRGERLCCEFAFEDYDDFVCPVCGKSGDSITEESVRKATPLCGLCGQPYEFLGYWVT